MTGNRLTSSDLLKSGLATHYVASELIPQLEMEIIDKCSNYDSKNQIDSTASAYENSYNLIKSIIEKYQDSSLGLNYPDLNTSIISLHGDLISTIFGEANTVEDIFINLENELNKQPDNTHRLWLEETLKQLQKQSPTSLKITFFQLNYGKLFINNLKDSLIMEFRIMNHCMGENDFYEGIRAVLVDKDNTPKWSPGHLSEVSNEFISSFFENLEKKGIKELDLD